VVFSLFAFLLLACLLLLFYHKARGREGGVGGKVLGGVDNDGSNNNKRVIGRSMQVFHDTVPVEQLSLVGSSRDTACGYLCGVVLLYHIICVVLSFFLPVICSTKSLFPLIGGWP